MTLTFCLFEDRAAEEVGLRLALSSIRHCCPLARVFVYRPDPGEDFARWLREFPNVTLVSERPARASSWNCKPHVLLPLLEQGHREVIWLDSDILLSRDPSYLFEGWSDDELGVVQEQISSARQGTEERTRGWGLAVGRTWPVTLNTCVLRVTRAHVPLLQRWQVMLEDERYLHWQTRPLSERPLCFMSDQDVLNGLMGSAEFSTMPVRFLRRGRDVIHSGGALAYSLKERLAGMSGPIPPIIHGQGAKPWIMFVHTAELTGRFWAYRRLLQEVSPYMALSRRYRDQLGMPCPWMDWHSSLGRLVRCLGLGHFALRGLPLTAAATALRWWQRLPTPQPTSEATP